MTTLYANTPSKKLRIAILMDDFFPNSGGVARSIQLQIDELQRAGHIVTLFAPKPFFVPPDHCWYEAMDVWRIPKTPSFMCTIRFNKKVVDTIIARHKRFDIVHSQNERGAMFLAARIAKRTGAKHVHTFHSNYAGTHRTSPLLSAINTFTYMRLAPFVMHLICRDRSGVKVRLPRRLPPEERSNLGKLDWMSVAKLARYVDAFTSPAQYIIDGINDATRDAIRERGSVIANGINPVFTKAKRIRPQNDTFRFLSCCRLDPEKRVDVIIQAYAKLAKADSELYIMDTGTDEAKLKKLADSIVKKGRVVFLGHFEDPERIANEFANSDVFVFASYHFDTQGMVLAEAAATGTAILLCDERLHVGITSENALLTHPSITAIAEGMRDLYDHPAQLLQMSDASRRVGTKLTPYKMCEAFLEVYSHALHE